EALREPVFSAYADVTVASPPMQTAPAAGYTMPDPASASPYGNSPTPYPYINGSHGSSYPQLPPTQPGINHQAPPPPAYSNQPPKRANGAPGSRMAPPVQKPVQPA